jgi:hypothetical protein
MKKTRTRTKETPTHCSWRAMWQRCTDPNASNYKFYGGRGIKICERWRKFDNFSHDMGTRPSLLHTIERLKNDKDYEPTNCVWSTKSRQARNRRSNSLLTVHGKTQCIAAWSKESGIKESTIWSRINVYGKSPEEAVALPVQRDKTHCINGHPLEGNNLILKGLGKSGKRHRNCRACAYISNSKSQKRRLARARQDRSIAIDTKL